MMSSENRREFAPKDAPITKVVVYRDRAEVTRTLRFKASPSADVELVVAGITTPIELGSLRVEGRGPAVITDVNLSDNFVGKSQLPETDRKEKTLRDKLENLNQQKTVEEADEARLVKQLAFWDKAVDSLATGVFTVKEGKSYPATAETYTNMSDFLKYQAEESRKIDELLVAKRKLVRHLQESIEAAERNLNDHKYGSRQTWDIVTTVNVEAEGELELGISYIVYNARWSPKYDVRVSQDSKKLEISYYGIITQSTGEDWIEIPVNLSTAVPALGGNIPSLGTKQVSFKTYRPAPPSHMYDYATVQRCSSTLMAKSSATAMHEERSASFAPEYMNAPMRMAVTNVVADSGITTSFEISKLTTVPSDGSEHKVTVGILHLQPRMQYKAVPKKAEQAFLEAKATNTSPYPILPGPASVFFGSNFVATVDLKTVSPQEEFSCSLGVDPAIKVKYRPVRRFTEQSGLLSKSNVVTYVQEIEVINTRPEPIRMVIIDQVPRSTEDKIRVTLIEPPLTQDKKEASGFVLNQDNNIEHLVDIKERGQFVWTIKYKLEYPSDKEIEEVELPSTL